MESQTTLLEDKNEEKRPIFKKGEEVAKSGEARVGKQSGRSYFPPYGVGFVVFLFFFFFLEKYCINTHTSILRGKTINFECFVVSYGKQYAVPFYLSPSSSPSKAFWVWHRLLKVFFEVSYCTVPYCVLYGTMVLLFLSSPFRSCLNFPGWAVKFLRVGESCCVELLKGEKRGNWSEEISTHNRTYHNNTGTLFLKVQSFFFY